MSNAVRTALFAASILGLLYVGWMFSNNMTIMLQPETWLKYFNTDGAFLNWSDPVIYPRFLHFMTGALAIGGLFVALLGQVRTNDDMIDTGMLWFTRATLINLAVGIWFLAALPQDILLAFMGRNIPATGTLVASLIAAAFMLIAGFKKNRKSHHLGGHYCLLHGMHPPLVANPVHCAVVLHRVHTSNWSLRLLLSFPRIPDRRPRCHGLHDQTLLQFTSGEELSHGIPHLATHDSGRRLLDRLYRDHPCLCSPFCCRRRTVPRPDRTSGIPHQQHSPA